MGLFKAKATGKLAKDQLFHELFEVEYVLNRGRKEASPLTETTKKERRNLLVICMVILTLLWSMTEKVYAFKITDGVVLDNFPLMRAAVLCLIIYQMVQYFISAAGDGVLDHYREMKAYQRFVELMRNYRNIPYDDINVKGDYEGLCQQVVQVSQEIHVKGNKVKHYKDFLHKMSGQAQLKKEIAFFRSFVLDSLLPFAIWFATFITVWNY